MIRSPSKTLFQNLLIISETPKAVSFLQPHKLSCFTASGSSQLFSSTILHVILDACFGFPSGLFSFGLNYFNKPVICGYFDVPNSSEPLIFIYWIIFGFWYRCWSSALIFMWNRCEGPKTVTWAKGHCVWFYKVVPEKL